MEEQWKQWQTMFLGSKITAQWLQPWNEKTFAPKRRKAMTNLDSVSKSRDVASPTKVRIVKAMCFPVVIYRCESWTIKKAEHWRTDAFKLWCWRRLLRVPWTASRSNHSILKEINPEYSLEVLMLKLKLQHFITRCEKPTHWEKPWWWETRLKAKREGGGRGRGREHHWINGHEFEQSLGDGEGQRSLACCSPWGCKDWDKTGTKWQQQPVLSHRNPTLPGPDQMLLPKEVFLNYQKQ